ncbi:phytochrome B-like [Tasmannia lanceolata]|uniref:phytochrome B-like n=1 Tax=Tasmannia lanceolata TaxID=3420 RepID=UPI004064508A
MSLGSRGTNTQNTNNKNKAIAQYNADARLLAAFEQSGESGNFFDYSKSVQSVTESVPEEQITAYLSRIQRGGLIQPFGCLLAFEENTFRIIAYSENSLKLLGLFEFKGLLGTDARTLFTPSDASSLEKAAGTREISLSNPIWVHSRSSGKQFYAILHRIDVGIVIDLEPVMSSDPALSIAGAVQLQKLAVKAISRLQSLPGGDIGLLCDSVVEEVQQLTGYDRVMVYKFHEDGHEEVLSEIRRSDLEPYLGLHYPVTNIPQASRFLFKQSRVRIICDCNAIPVGVIQDEGLKQPLCLVNSTLRSPHDCHTQYMANMGSIASLVMAIVINGNDKTKLWGLVVCHHTSPRYVPFPLRYACEFLMQALGLQLNMELQLAAQLAEKKVLRTQTLLCDMLLRDAPFGIVTQSPSIMDLVKCDGAALYYGGMCWLLGVTPTEAQVKDIVEWLLTCHGDSTGLSTDSLADAGYPGAHAFGDAVCGIATARITSKDFLFWFRSHIAKEFKWGGAKHHPEDKDGGGRMHPRSSFKTFLEVVKRRSLPWEVSEMNAIHSLQLIMRGSFQDIEDSGAKTMPRAQLGDLEMQGMDELSSVACDMVRLIETATTPIFAVDSAGLINGWNAKVAELTGLPANEAMGKSLVHDVVHEEFREAVGNHLSRALQGKEDKNVELKLKTFGLQQQNSAIFIVANACSSKDYRDSVIGVCFVGQDVTQEKAVMDKFIRLQGDYKAIIHSPNPLIPPIFASDQNTCCSEWNAAMEKLTGWTRVEVIGKMLLGEIFGGLCQLKGQDALTKFMILLHSTIGGKETEKFPFGFFDRKGNYIEVLLTANKRTDMGGHVVGCFCFLQSVTPELQETLEVQRQEESKCIDRLKELTYIRQEMRNPLNGIRFTHNLLETSGISDDQKQLLETGAACGRQMMKIIEDMDLESIDDGYMELDMTNFNLGSVVDAIVSQVMFVLRERNLQLVRDIPEEIKTMSLYGDQIRLQQVLADFLLNIAYHAPSSDGWVEIEVAPSLRLIENGVEFVHLQFRMTHPGQGLPSKLVDDMFGGNRWATQEGLGLNMSRKLLKMMSGHIQYVREATKCYFLINIKFQTTKRIVGGTM